MVDSLPITRSSGYRALQQANIPIFRLIWHDSFMTSTLITVAPTGAETAKADCPALPTTLEELVGTAKRCEAAGAAMIHIHIRDAEHRPTLDLGRLTETVAAIRENTALVVQLSTGGAVTDPFEHRLRVLDATPDSCSLTMGTVNFGDDVFMNPWPFVTELYRLTQEREVVPEFELFDLGHVAALHRSPAVCPVRRTRWLPRSTVCPVPSRRGPRQASAVRRCRWRWLLCRRAATCGSEWRTP
jgi:hypothetical protein